MLRPPFYYGNTADGLKELEHAISFQNWAIGNKYWDDDYDSISFGRGRKTKNVKR